MSAVREAIKILPRIVLRGPICATKTQILHSIYHDAVETGMKCLENGCDACTAACYIAKELTNANLTQPGDSESVNPNIPHAPNKPDAPNKPFAPNKPYAPNKPDAPNKPNVWDHLGPGIPGAPYIPANERMSSNESPICGKSEGLPNASDNQPARKSRPSKPGWMNPSIHPDGWSPNPNPNHEDSGAENPINAFGIITMDCKGFMCTLQVPENELAIIKAGFQSTKDGGLSIAAEPELAERLGKELKENICPECLLKRLFTAEKNTNHPLGGICMNKSGAIGVASLTGSMPWVVAKSGTYRWSGCDKGSYCIFDSC